MRSSSLSSASILMAFLPPTRWAPQRALPGHYPRNAIRRSTTAFPVTGQSTGPGARGPIEVVVGKDFDDGKALGKGHEGCLVSHAPSGDGGSLVCRVGGGRDTMGARAVQVDARGRDGSDRGHELVERVCDPATMVALDGPVRCGLGGCSAPGCCRRPRRRPTVGASAPHRREPGFEGERAAGEWVAIGSSLG